MGSHVTTQLQRWTSSVPGGRRLKRRLHNHVAACGLTLWLSRAGSRADTFMIVTHHRVTTQPDPYYPLHYSIALEALEAQLAMCRRFCTVLSLDEILHRVEQGVPLPKRCVALTFDDGYRELFTLVHPLLQQYQLPATLFVATDALDRGFLWPDLLRWAIRSTGESCLTLETLADEPRTFALETEWHRIRAAIELDRRLKRGDEPTKGRILAELVQRLQHTAPERSFVPRVMLTWDEVRLMADQGWTIGSHTVTHPILTHVTPEQAREELTRSRDTLQQRLGRPVTHFAYPNGRADDFSPAIERAVAAAGYRSACTTINGINHRSQPRVALRRIDGAQGSLREFVRVLEESDGCHASA